jgi:hypothetical protein
MDASAWAVTAVATGTVLLTFLNKVAKSDFAAKVFEWTKFLLSRKEGRNAQFSKVATFKTINAARELNIKLNRIVRDDGPTVRVNAVVLHNGGGVLTEKERPKYVTVFETADIGMKQDSREHWEKQPLTDAYCRDVLFPLMRDGRAELRTEDLSEDNPLKPYYIIDGIKEALVELALATPTATWYVSTNHLDLELEPRSFEDRMRLLLARESTRQAASLLRKLAPSLPPPEELYR